MLPSHRPRTCLLACLIPARCHPLQTCQAYNKPGLGLRVNATTPDNGLVLDAEAVLTCISDELCGLNLRRAGNATDVGALTSVSCNA